MRSRRSRDPRKSRCVIRFIWDPSSVTMMQSTKLVLIVLALAAANIEQHPETSSEFVVPESMANEDDSTNSPPHTRLRLRQLELQNQQLLQLLRNQQRQIEEHQYQQRQILELLSARSAGDVAPGNLKEPIRKNHSEVSDEEQMLQRGFQTTLELTKYAPMLNQFLREIEHRKPAFLRLILNLEPLSQILFQVSKHENLLVRLLKSESLYDLEPLFEMTHELTPHMPMITEYLKGDDLKAVMQLLCAFDVKMIYDLVGSALKALDSASWLVRGQIDMEPMKHFLGQLFSRLEPAFNQVKRSSGRRFCRAIGMK